ncbi:MAG: hypothetical protein LBP35_00350 [Candidatus Ancillula trichonymphae]|nr:hypothetical protein [Candidatus Ancillula trichonymphae]
MDGFNNPYFGFPQMVRFAFNPNERSRKVIEELKTLGVDSGLNELFYPVSTKKSPTREHTKFKHETEVLELLRVIDGTATDRQVLSFLDNNEQIKNGELCKHIVVGFTIQN